MDVIEVEVFSKLFASIAEEMGIVLARSAFSSNIKERRDFSCAIFDRKGSLIAQAAHIPVHLGAMPATLEHVLAHHCLEPGDIIIVNNPFQGGSHLPDITLIEALFNSKGEPLFYLVNRAHHADVGGKVPGSMGFAQNFEDEGFLISPTFLYRRGECNHGFLNNFLSQVRNPDERQGDLQAQQAALGRGKIRLTEILQHYGVSHTFITIKKLQDYSEKLMRQTISHLNDGSYSFSDVLDNDGLNQEPLPISARIIISHDQAIIDFSGTASQVNSPINTVQPVTIAATIYVFQCLLGEGYPINAGSYRPITIKTRPGTLVDATSPAPVAAGNVETSQRIVDVLFGALAQGASNRIPAASCGSMNNIAIGSSKERKSAKFTYYETIGGGMGGRPSRPGLSGIQTHMTNTMNTPVEALERSYPLQISHYKLRKNSGGTGLHPGGNGISRGYRFLEKARISLLTERRETAPYGLAGGQDGEMGKNYLVRDGETRKLAGKVNLKVKAGDMIIIESPGGGGWGGK